MREASFLAPLKDNDGRPTTLALANVESSLLRTFGGYTTESAIRGAWRDDSSGKVYNDSLVRYIVAANWSPATVASLRGIVERLAIDAKQLSVYLKLANGKVEFVTPSANDSSGKLAA